MSNAVSGEQNGRFSGISDDAIEKHAIELTKTLGHRFSNNIWVKYASKHGLPQYFSEFRQQNWKSVTALGVWAAEQLNIPSDVDPRLQRTFNSAIAQGYEARIENNEVLVERKCEQCGKSFENEYQSREIAVCGRTCSNHYLNARGTNVKRTASINAKRAQMGSELKIKQVSAYTEAQFKLGREPMLKEWEESCREKGIAFRMKTKYGFKNIAELRKKASLFNHRVVSVELDGIEDVYNGTVDEFHNFFVGGWEVKCKNGKRKSLYINNLNCGEIPLSAYDSCRLLLLNLFGFVKNPFTKDAYFDYAEFYKVTQVAQRLMDDLIDMEEEAIMGIIEKIQNDPESEAIKCRELSLWQNILDACRNGRRTGTGITALGDALAAMGIAYGSDYGIEVTETIYKTLKFGAYRASVDMAKELGPFKVWDHELEKDNPILNRIKDEIILLNDDSSTETEHLLRVKKILGSEIWNDMKKYGRRNIALLTTAPAGSVSLETQTSSGIEPQFMIDPYTRRKKGNPGDVNFRSDFVDQSGDHYMEFEIYPPKVAEWMRITGETDINKSPWRGSCAGEIEWTQRVKLQAAAQRHVDHSISSTLNLPHDVTVEKVDEIYRTAWKAGCKGITIYRDGCRTGVLVKKDEKKDAVIQKTNAPKRPIELPCDVYHIKAKGEEYFVLVGTLGEKKEPYEVFAGKNGMIAKSVKSGVVTKRSRGKYDAVFDDGNEIKNVADFLSDEEEAVTRMVSTALRHGADVTFVVHQLEKTKGSLIGFAKAMARALKNYVPDEDRQKQQDTGEICPQDGCGGKIVRSDGCYYCVSCGYSKCS
jgi:ribonucleotide reductase alpha subunit